MCFHDFPPKKPLDPNLDELTIFKERGVYPGASLGAAVGGNAVDPIDCPATRARLLRDITQARRELDYYRQKEELLTLRVRVSKTRKAIDALEKELRS